MTARQLAASAVRPIRRLAPAPSVNTVFAGLVLGMLISSMNLTVVAPALPRIVAELGGIERYSWVGLATLLPSTVVVPLVGKLSDLRGRKPFYIAGVLILMLGSILAGLAPSFEALVAARFIQGIGTGTMQPISQAVIGDLVPPRDRGKYQSVMAAVFGVASIAGPVVGGAIVDQLGWRWLFWVGLPFGVLAVLAVVLFMHIPHEARPHSLDLVGMATISVAITGVVLATQIGGREVEWTSTWVIGLYAVSLIALVVFVRAERHAREPVLPLELLKDPVFTLANVGAMGVTAAMMGGIYFIPVYVQGALGQGASSSGTVLVPMLMGMIATVIASGQLLSRTGRYKPTIVAGVITLLAGYTLLVLLDPSAGELEVVRDMVVVGLGIGACQATYTVVVQNAVTSRHMGVATASSQLARSLGGSLGLAIMGVVLGQQLAANVSHHLGPAELAAIRAAHAAGVGIGAALDPDLATSLPPAALAGVHAVFADSIPPVFASVLPFIVLSLVAGLLLREVPLTRKAHRTVAAPSRVVLELEGAPLDEDARSDDRGDRR